MAQTHDIHQVGNSILHSYPKTKLTNKILNEQLRHSLQHFICVPRFESLGKYLTHANRVKTPA